MGQPTQTTTDEVRARAQIIARRLRRAYPDAKCSLDFTTPLELLVATILSAQCTDERVNVVTKSLFKKYRAAEDYVRVKPEELENDIHSTGFYRAKAKHIRGCCQTLIEKFGGDVPDNMEDLTQLPGVGRKTANVILGNYYGQPAITVDTHVKRLSGRLGLTDETDPDKIELDLQKVLPKKDWTFLSHALILHGRQVCHARKPQCGECVLRDLCPSASP
jgi:endonuclease-3